MPKAKTVLTRIVFGTIMAAGLAGVLVLEHLEIPRNPADARGLILGVIVAALTVLAFLEVARLARSAGGGVLPISGLLGAVVLGTLPVWRQGLGASMILEDVLFLLGAVTILVFLEQMIRHRIERAIARIATTLLAVLYLGVGAAILLAIRIDRGVPALVLFLAAVKFTDIGAYFTGIAIGRHKLIPWLSPGKTWEGLLGGIAAAAGVSVLAVWTFGHWPQTAIRLSLAEAAVFGVAMAVSGQFGDLCESLLKRSAQVKDSGALVPEFGGVLDILDSPLLAAPVAYLLLEVMA